MTRRTDTRRAFLKSASLATGALLLSATRAASLDPASAEAASEPTAALRGSGIAFQEGAGHADYTLQIRDSPIELAPNRIVSTTTYNSQFPGPLLRFKEGRPVTVDILNDTDTPEQLHWHGQKVSVDIDGAAEEGTPYVPAHGRRRITFTPRPAGLRFYHTHNRAGANLYAGTYSGQAGPVYIEPKDDPGNYDREIFLVLKEFEPTFSRGGDMPQDFLSPTPRNKALEEAGESAMKASLAKGVPHGYEVGYSSFTINGRMLGHGEPIRVRRSQRVLFHILNASATEIRSLALPGHTFQVLALDGNPVPNPARVPVLWIGTAERISAVVEMNHPGVWILGDLDNDDRGHGMGIVVEYAGQPGQPQWIAPPPFRWSYSHFARPGAVAPAPDQTFELTLAKDNAALEGFNRWTINGIAFPASAMSELTPSLPPVSYLGPGYVLRTEPGLACPSADGVVGTFQSVSYPVGTCPTPRGPLSRYLPACFSLPFHAVNYPPASYTEPGILPWPPAGNSLASCPPASSSHSSDCRSRYPQSRSDSNHAQLGSLSRFAQSSVTAYRSDSPASAAMNARPLAQFLLHEGKRYRLRLRNASDDIHPIHLHRHTFEITGIAGQSTAGVLKDVFMLGGYQEAEIDFIADNPGLTLFHCHQQLHMDFGLMTLFDYA